MKVFLQAIVAQVLLNPYIFWRGYQALPQKRCWRVPYALFFIVELTLYFTGFFFHTWLPNNLMIAIEKICGTWYIASLYITLCLLVLEVIRITQKRWQWLPHLITAHGERVKSLCFLLIIMGVSALMVKAHHTVMYPTVRSLHLTLPKGSSTRDSLTIVMMSDLHIGEMVDKALVQRYVQLANEQHPDMVVLVGDILDYESRFAEKAHIEEDLRRLQAPLGVYMVYGNHEYRANRHAKNRWFRKTGATLLVDSVVMPDSTFYLIGRDDYVNKRRRKPLHALMAHVDTTKPIIVLDHQPWSFAELAMNGVDLGLYGHTHYGQLWPYPLLMHAVYECPYGYYRKGHTQYYVSSGIGFAGPPYRVGTASELVVLRIKFQ